MDGRRVRWAAPSEGLRAPPAEPNVVLSYGAATQEAYVYLPGRGEPWYDLNTRPILRAVEGNWFAASRDWTTFVERFVTL